MSANHTSPTPSKTPQDVLARLSGAQASSDAPDRRQCAAVTALVPLQTVENRQVLPVPEVTRG